MPFIKRRGAVPKAGHPASGPDGEASSAAVRRAAALAAVGEPRAVDRLLVALIEEDARDVRAAIVTALIASGSEDAAVGLAGLVGSEDAAMRNEAVVALRCLGAVASGPVVGLLDHPDPDRRQLAIGALNVLPPTQARSRLRAVLRHDPEVNVGLAAVEVLAQLGEPEDASALHAFVGRFPEEPLVRFAVEQAVGQIGGGTTP